AAFIPYSPVAAPVTAWLLACLTPAAQPPRHRGGYGSPLSHRRADPVAAPVTAWLFACLTPAAQPPRHRGGYNTRRIYPVFSRSRAGDGVALRLAHPARFHPPRLHRSPVTRRGLFAWITPSAQPPRHRGGYVRKSHHDERKGVSGRNTLRISRIKMDNPKRGCSLAPIRAIRN
ncbi:MAG: hypothetical protein WCL16_10455, partial [bacterium]